MPFKKLSRKNLTCTGDNGRIYIRDGSSVGDELEERTIASLQNPGKQTNHPSGTSLGKGQ